MQERPAPRIVSLLADRDVGVRVPYALRRIGNLSLLDFWILDLMFLALLLFASYFTSSSAIHRSSREMSFIIFADGDYAR